MTDGELRALCHRFFDALEGRDIDTLAEIYGDDLQFWFNVTGKTSTREENLTALTAGYAVHRRRQYSDRTIDTFDGGFVMRYTLNITQHSGKRSTLYPCIVVHCKDGKFVRMDEYIDSSKFTRPVASLEAVAKDGASA